jgi:lipoyl(octanoyl) transferase
VSDLLVCHLGRVEYRTGAALQEHLRRRVQAGDLEDVVLLLEHDPVYTLGRRSEPGDLPMGEQWYEMQGIDVARTDRGGKVTYHGPGQLVGYPIVRVDDVVAYVRSLERAIVSALAAHGLEACTREGPDFTGVWIGDRKVASIGVHVQRGVTTHGFAINVDNDLQPFEWVVACGLPEVRMTSICRETGTGDNLACFRRRMAHALCSELGRRQRLIAPQRFGAGRSGELQREPSPSTV